MENEKMYFHYKSSEKQDFVKQNDIYEIYSKFVDDRSRRIFADRLMFSLTNDWKFIRDILLETGNWSELGKILASYKEIYIYGAGIAGGRLPLIFPEYPWKGYIDKNKKGETCNGLPIYGIEECGHLPNESAVLISNMTGADEIRRELLAVGISKNVITYIEYTNKVAKNMYFENECLEKERVRGKIFVDAGAYDGIDTIHFFNWMNDTKSSKAIVFEADSDNYEIVKKKLALYSQIRIYNRGLSDVSEQKRFLSGHGEMSNFSFEGCDMVCLDKLDDLISDEKVGYIKMDIEGYERKALMGAKKIVMEQSPMLAVSIYHKREDIWRLPKLIMGINNDYKFFLRHYSLGVVDTVLYAV